MIVLAAGASSRMGKPKPLLDFGGRAVIDRVLDVCLEGGASEAIVVVAAKDDPLKTKIAGRPNVTIAINDRPERGQSSSVRIGVALVGPGAAAFFVLPADHPLLEPLDVKLLIEAFEALRPEATIVIPTWHGRRGHPVLLGAMHRERVAALPDGETLRDYLRAREIEIEVVTASGPGVVTGINTEDEYRAALRTARSA